LKNSVLKEGNWPASKSEITNRNLKQFIRYEGWNFNSRNYLFTTDTK